MGISNRARVDKALELLREGLAPYVERELQSEKGKAVSPETFQHLSRKPVGDWDIAPLLKLMVIPNVWKTVFRPKCKDIERSLVSELRVWRNKWAHQEELSNNDIHRALDSAERLLRAFSITQQADEIADMREEFRRVMNAIHTPTEKRKKDGSSNAESGDANVDGECGSKVLNRPDYHRGGSIDTRQIYQDYTDLIGEIVEGEIYQIRRYKVLVLHTRHETGRCAELVLPRSEQLPQDWYREGKSLRAVVKEVQWDDDEKVQVIVSRRDPVFLERLLEMELPEEYSVQRIAWEPGEGVIVALWSRVPPIDEIPYPVRFEPFYAIAESTRLKAVARYGKGDADMLNSVEYICQEVFEPISLIRYSSDPHRLLEQVFSPAKPIVARIPGGEEPPRVEVVAKAEEIGQVIGRNGINIRLASRLSGCQIDVRVS